MDENRGLLLAHFMPRPVDATSRLQGSPRWRQIGGPIPLRNIKPSPVPKTSSIYLTAFVCLTTSSPSTTTTGIHDGSKASLLGIRCDTTRQVGCWFPSSFITGRAQGATLASNPPLTAVFFESPLSLGIVNLKPLRRELMPASDRAN